MMQIKQVPKAYMQELISTQIGPKLTKDQIKQFNRCVASTQTMWVGTIEDDFIGILGAIPPTLMSDQAYLWFYATNELVGNEFMFIRSSQRFIEKILAVYPIVVGHCVIGQYRSKRWLRLLGAEFGDPVDKLVPFTIRRKNG